MRDIRERNKSIVRQRHDGIPISVVAKEFRLSVERVRLIVDADRLEWEQRARSIRFLETLQRSDDPDLRWPVSDIIETLVPLMKTRTALLDFFEMSSVKEMNMRDFMDLVISDKKCPMLGYSLTRLLSIRNIGSKGFWFVVNRLTAIQLGPKCRAIWERKLARLRKAHRIKGSLPYSWSKPVRNPYPHAAHE